MDVKIVGNSNVGANVDVVVVYQTHPLLHETLKKEGDKWDGSEIAKRKKLIKIGKRKRTRLKELV